MCVSPSEDFAVVCACFANVFQALDGRYIGDAVLARDLHDSLIYEHRASRSRASFSARMSYGDFLRGSPSPATEIDTSMISIADVAGDAMQCRPKSIRFHLSRYCASDLNASGCLRSILERLIRANLHLRLDNRSFLGFDRRRYRVPESRWRASNETFTNSVKKRRAKRARRLQIEVSNWDK